jgi:Mannosyltransferase putative
LLIARFRAETLAQGYMADVMDATGAIAKRLAARESYPVDRFRGRGIVVCAGGVRMFVNAYVLVRILRETLRCRLPIQIWHLGADELSPVMRTLVEERGVEPIDAHALLAEHPAAIADGWQLKSYAIIHSPFQEVLLLDADQVPVRDPIEVFRWPQYLEAGAVFWPDIFDLVPENPVWSLCGLEPRRCASVESGQLLVDKQRHWAALDLVLFLNEQAETLYQLVYGDKDTFLVGWLLANAPYALVPHRPFIDARCLVQRDFAGAALFQHRTGAKWAYALSQIDLPNFEHEQDCLRFLDDLRRAWNGALFHPPARGLAARAAETALIGTRMRLVVCGEPELEVEFLAGHQFGAGRGPTLQNWYVGDGENGLDLVVRDTDRDTYRLTPQADGRWTGRRISAPRAEARLTPIERPVRASEDDGLIADLVAASGLSVVCTDVAAAELLAALRLIDRAQPGVADRLRAFAARRCAGNDSLRRSLNAIADDLPKPLPAARSVRVPADEVLARGYTRA